MVQFTRPPLVGVCSRNVLAVVARTDFLFADFLLDFTPEPFCPALILLFQFVIELFDLFRLDHENNLFELFAAFSEVIGTAFAVSHIQPSFHCS